MSRLQQLQSRFQDALLKNDPAFNDDIVATRKVDIATRIGIYGNAYRARLIEALEDTFDAVHTLLGDEQFYRLCDLYIDAFPSQHYSIRWYGHKFAEFTRGTTPYSDHPYVSELAEFQWKLTEAFDAADAEPATSEELTRIAPASWPELRFDFHPAVRRLDLCWSVPAFWQAVDQKRQDIEPPEKAAQRVPWVIYRKDLRQYFRSMEPPEAWALDAAMNGVVFAELCEGLLQWKSADDAALYAAQLLQRWLSDHMLSAIRAPD